MLPPVRVPSAPMPPRIHVPAQPWSAGLTITLPPGPSRHLQVLRLQPGHPVTLFDGEGGEWSARVVAMGRSAVEVCVEAHDPVMREAACAVTLAVGMPANDRMDTLVEKATELGVAALQPLVCERSVLRLAGERAERKVLHWQGVAAAASEQSGRTRVPHIEPVRALDDWLASMPAAAPGEVRGVLSLASRRGWSTLGWPAPAACLLSGPEGGLTGAEEALAVARGFEPVSLGPRTLRADTAPLAALAWIVLAGIPSG